MLQILDRLATREGEDVDAFVRRPSEGVPGGFTVKGFLRLIQLFIDKKQVRRVRGAGGRGTGGGGGGVPFYSSFLLAFLRNPLGGAF